MAFKFKDDGRDVLGDVLNDSTKQAYNPHAGNGYEPVGTFRTTSERPQPRVDDAPAPTPAEPPKDYVEAELFRWRAENPDLSGYESYVKAHAERIERANPTISPYDLLTQAGQAVRQDVRGVFEAGRQTEANERRAVSAQSQAEAERIVNEHIGTLRSFAPKTT